jgi:hypothetical protein
MKTGKYIIILRARIDGLEERIRYVNDGMNPTPYLVDAAIHEDLDDVKETHKIFNKKWPEYESFTKEIVLQ